MTATQPEPPLRREAGAVLAALPPGTAAAFQRALDAVVGKYWAIASAVNSPEAAASTEAGRRWAAGDDSDTIPAEAVLSPALPPEREPWMLAVSLAPPEFRDAVQGTQAWLARPGRHVGVDYRPETCQIVLAGERWELLAQLNQYALWQSAQIDFRPVSDVPLESTPPELTLPSPSTQTGPPEWSTVALAAAKLAGEPEPVPPARLARYEEAVRAGRWTLPEED